jgi:ABC-type amino acid transport substrate-binding protein
MCDAGANAAQGGPAPLHIVTAHLPPLVIGPDDGPAGDKRPGALRELVDALCKRLGLAPDVEFMPWRRALYVAATTPQTAIFPLTRVAERERHYRWLAPLYDENYIFMARKDSAFDIHRPEEMTDKRIALLRGAAQSAILRELGFQAVVEASSIEEVHRFLLAGMADAVFGERAIIHRSLDLHGAEKDFHLSRPVRSTTAWVAGSRDIAEGEAARWRAAMAELVADGTQKRIFRHYGLA